MKREGDTVLHPCYCGGEAIIETSRYTPGSDSHGHNLPHESSITCQDCGRSVKMQHSLEAQHDDALYERDLFFLEADWVRGNPQPYYPYYQPIAPPPYFPPLWRLTLRCLYAP